MPIVSSGSQRAASQGCPALGSLLKVLAAMFDEHSLQWCLLHPPSCRENGGPPDCLDIAIYPYHPFTISSVVASGGDEWLVVPEARDKIPGCRTIHFASRQGGRVKLVRVNLIFDLSRFGIPSSKKIVAKRRRIGDVWVADESSQVSYEFATPRVGPSRYKTD